MLETRLATLGDLTHILNMAKDLHAESPYYSKATFDEDKTARLLIATIENGKMILITYDQKIIGMTAYLIHEHLFSSSKIAIETTMYLKQEYRSLPAFRALLARLEKEAFAHDVLNLTVGTTTGIQADRVLKLYERHGYNLVGYTLVKDIQ